VHARLSGAASSLRGADDRRRFGKGRKAEAVVRMFKSISYGVLGGVALTILAIAFQGCVAGVHQAPIVVPR
jgi:hypothetical protein